MADHCAASSSWSELPWDLLDRILQQHLELPEALAVAAVCAPWRSAAVASGVPPLRTPWLVSHTELDTESPAGSEFRNLLFLLDNTTNKTTYTVSLPQGRRHLAWCGASRGWLVASDEISALLLYNPFTFALIPLPPITDLGGVRAVYDEDDGTTVIGYLYGKSNELLCRPLDKHHCRFYKKVILSCDPSRGGDGGGRDCIAMAIYGMNQVSFARAGESSWRLDPTTPSHMIPDSCADCVYHDGRFYAVTRAGAVETWDLDRGPAHDELEARVIIAEDGMFESILGRFLVSTPWGRLLQIQIHRHRRPKVEVLEVDVQERKLVTLTPATAFQDHAVFVGLNESACLRAQDFPELKPNSVYFTTPWMVQEENSGPGGVAIYDLKSHTFQHVLTRPERSELIMFTQPVYLNY